MRRQSGRYSTAFALMLGVGFALTAIATVLDRTRRLVALLTEVVVATMLIVNVLNPDARVAEHNVNRADAAERLDAE